MWGQGGRRAKVNAGGRQDPDPGLAGPCEWNPSPSQQSDLTFPSSEFSVGWGHVPEEPCGTHELCEL